LKVFASGTFAKPLTDEQRKQMLPKEVPDTLKMYFDGKIDQFWSHEDQSGVVFLMNAASVQECDATAYNACQGLIRHFGETLRIRNGDSFAKRKTSRFSRSALIKMYR
jgi:hypothetical protein